MNIIDKDIAFAKGIAQIIEKGDNWQDIMLRLALEVERLRDRNALLELELTASAAALAAYDSSIDSIRAGVLAENAALRAAICETIEANLHLADGDNCTLLKLKQAINWELPQ